MSGLWIPVVGSICITFILITYFMLKSRDKADVQTTIRDALDKGNPLTPELIEKMSVIKSPKVADLRRGIVLVSLGIAVFLAGWLAGELRDTSPISMFPLMLGFGFLTVWKINKYD